MNQRCGSGSEFGSKPIPCSESGNGSYSSFVRFGTTSRTPLRGSWRDRGNASSPYEGNCGRIGGNNSGGGSGSAAVSRTDAPGSGLKSAGGNGTVWLSSWLTIVTWPMKSFFRGAVSTLGCRETTSIEATFVFACPEISTNCAEAGPTKVSPAIKRPRRKNAPVIDRADQRMGGGACRKSQGKGKSPSLEGRAPSRPQTWDDTEVVPPAAIRLPFRRIKNRKIDKLFW